MDMDRIAGQLGAPQPANPFRALTRRANLERSSAASQRNLRFLPGSPLRGMPTHREPAEALHWSLDCPLDVDMLKRPKCANSGHVWTAPRGQGLL